MADRMNGAGDLGRRVKERRSELGLSVVELAHRAGMSPTYVRVLESSPASQPSRAALWKLAAALDTSVDDIAGGGMEAPPGRPRPSARPAIEHLSADECMALIAPGGIGRFVFVDQREPVAWPVNFRIVDGDVVFRTNSGSAALDALSDGDTSFEVDRVDDALTEGWSVLLTGVSRVITEPIERERARASGVTPWAGGEHDAFVRMEPQTITGRRIRRLSFRG